MDIKDLIMELKSIPVSNPRLEAEIMLEYHNDNIDKLNQFIKARKEGQPLCKIVGFKGFYKHDFMVSKDVLSPRADSEILVEKAVSILKKTKKNKILELGVGSGCLILSILYDIIDAKGVGLDISNKALDISIKNAKHLNLESRFKTICSSWFDKRLPELLLDKFDMIISNPPYIPSKDIENLEEEVKEYDPILALDGGIDGLRDYRSIAKISKSLLNKDGYIVLEVGIGQHRDVISIFEKEDFKFVEVVRDYGNIERCIVLQNS